MLLELHDGSPRYALTHFSLLAGGQSSHIYFIPVAAAGGPLIRPTCHRPLPITDYSASAARPVQVPPPALFAFETERVIQG
jgi:hypothetical protein